MVLWSFLLISTLNPVSSFSLRVKQRVIMWLIPDGCSGYKHILSIYIHIVKLVYFKEESSYILSVWCLFNLTPRKASYMFYICTSALQRVICTASMMFPYMSYIFPQENIYFLKLYGFPSFSLIHVLGIIFLQINVEEEVIIKRK